MGIHAWMEGGRCWFRVRGIGATYVAFYEWLRTKKLADQWDDFPWHGFTFADPADGDELVTKFADQFVGFDDEDEDEDDEG